MLSPSMLERVSVSYRNGYYDGHSGAAHKNTRNTADVIRPFSDHDYDAGYKAGANDRLWTAFHGGQILASDLPQSTTTTP